MYFSHQLHITEPFKCGVSDEKAAKDTSGIGHSHKSPDVGCKLIYTHVEADNALYKDPYRGENSMQQTVAYLDGLFNEVSLIFRHEGISLVMSHYSIWTTPDPYIRDKTEDALEAFRIIGFTPGSNFRQANGDPNGQLAFLVSGLASGGTTGIAYYPGLCSDGYQFGVARKSVAPNLINFQDAYSQTIAHEIGHLLGSHHTQWCGWDGGAIDGCWTPEGSCGRGPIPSPGGGTIMSYCHNNYGINIINGFGEQPGETIRNTVRNAYCVFNPGDIRPYNLYVTNIEETQATLVWNPGYSGNTLFGVQYRPTNYSSNYITFYTRNLSYPVAGLSPDTDYTFRVFGNCNNGNSSEATFITCSSPDTKSTGVIFKLCQLWV